MNHSHIMILSSKGIFSQEMIAYFEENKYRVNHYTIYSEAVTALVKGKSRPDVLLLHIDEPSWEIYDLIRIVRENSNIPILLLTDDGRLESQLYAYSMKIDDYMVKPVPFPLIEAHIEAIFRRLHSTNTLTKITEGELTLDFEARKITLAGKPKDLTAKEFDLLSFLVKHKGIVLSRDKILDSVWGFDYVGSYRSVDTLVKNLRAKLTGQYPYIKTIYGVGYCFEVQEREV